MTKQPKIIKRQDKPAHPEAYRMAVALKAVLKRRYPDPNERQEVAQKIMQEVKAA